MFQSFVRVFASLQRPHRGWKQDICHRAHVRPRRRGPPHLPSGGAQTGPWSLWPQLQRVLCWLSNPHQAAFSGFPQKGEITVWFKKNNINLSHFNVFDQTFPIARRLIFLSDTRDLKMEKLVNRVVWKGSFGMLWVSFCCQELRVEGSWRFGWWLAWSMCSIHLPSASTPLNQGGSFCPWVKEFVY